MPTHEEVREALKGRGLTDVDIGGLLGDPIDPNIGYVPGEPQIVNQASGAGLMQPAQPEAAYVPSMPTVTQGGVQQVDGSQMQPVAPQQPQVTDLGTIGNAGSYPITDLGRVGGPTSGATSEASMIPGLDAVTGLFRKPDQVEHGPPPQVTAAQLAGGVVPTAAAPQVGSGKVTVDLRPGSSGGQLGGYENQLGALGKQELRDAGKTEDAYRHAADAQADAVRASADLESEKLRAQAQVQGERNRLIDQAHGEFAKKQEALQRTIDDDAARTATLNKDYLEESQKDPTQQSFANRLGAGLAIALGAMGAALTGGPNYALQIVQQKTQEQIAAHRDKVAGKKGAIENQRNLYSDHLQQLGNAQAAQAATELAYTQQAQRQLEQMTSGSASKEVQANAAKTMADLQQHQAELAAQLRQGSTQRATQLIGQQAEIEGRREALGLEREKIGIEASKANMKPNERVVPGVGVAVSEDAAKKAIALKNGADVIANGVNQLLAIRQKHGGGFNETMHPDDAATVNKVVISLKYAIKDQKQLGVLSDKEYDRLDNMIGDAASYSPTGRIDADLKAFMGTTVRETNAAFKNYGLPGYEAPTSSMDAREAVGAK